MIIVLKLLIGWIDEIEGSREDRSQLQSSSLISTRSSRDWFENTQQRHRYYIGQSFKDKKFGESFFSCIGIKIIGRIPGTY